MSATRLILDAEIDDHVQIEYTSSHSNNILSASGTVTSCDRGLWCRFEDENNEYEVFGSETSNRQKGETTRDGRKIGQLHSFTITKKGPE